MCEWLKVCSAAVCLGFRPFSLFSKTKNEEAHGAASFLLHLIAPCPYSFPIQLASYMKCRARPCLCRSELAASYASLSGNRGFAPSFRRSNGGPFTHNFLQTEVIGTATTPGIMSGRDMAKETEVGMEIEEGGEAIGMVTGTAQGGMIAGIENPEKGAETSMTGLRAGMTTTGLTVDRVMTSEVHLDLPGIVMIWDLHLTVEEGEEEGERETVVRIRGLPLRRILFRYLRGNGRHQAGMCMLRATSSIRRRKPNRQVRCCAVIMSVFTNPLSLRSVQPSRCK